MAKGWKKLTVGRDPMSYEVTPMNDTLARVAGRIRRSEIVLWVGAGFNKKAGLPLGSDLVTLIKQQCTDSERRYLSKSGASLPEVAEQFVQMRSGSRADLNLLLEQSLNRDSVDLSLHEMIRDLFQVRNIVTTNYDHLFERVYRRSIHTITRSAQTVPVGSTSKFRLYKVHGDIAEPESIVICRSDFRKLLQSYEKDYIWRAVSALVAEKSVLFIGYGFDDQSVQGMFSDMMDMMRSLRQESYFIASSIPKHRRGMLAKYNIVPIEMTAEAAIKWLYRDVPRHLLEDCNAGLIGFDEADTLSRKLHGVALATTQVGNMRQFGVIGGEVRIKTTSAHRSDIEQFLGDITKDGICLPIGSVESIDLATPSALLPIFPDARSVSLDLFRQPDFKGHGTLMLTGSSRLALPVRVRSFAAKDEERLDIECSTFILRFIRKGNVVSIERKGFYCPDLCANMLGTQFEIAYLEGGTDLTLSVEGQPTKKLGATTRGPEKLLDSLRYLKTVFEKLTIVADSCDLTFELPEILSKSDLESLERAVGAIQGRRWPLPALETELSSEDPLVSKALKGPVPLRLRNQPSTKITLFGQETDLGVEVAEAIDAVIVNKSEVEDALARGTKTAIPITFESQSGDLVLYYDRVQSHASATEQQ